MCQKCPQEEMSAEFIVSCEVCGTEEDCVCWECPGCDDYISGEDDSPCDGCEQCEGCCQCWTCEGCERKRDRDQSQCENCNCCDRCCTCWYCEGCNQHHSEGEWSCADCNGCESCCSCNKCADCGKRVDEDEYCGDCNCCKSCCSCAPDPGDSARMLRPVVGAIAAERGEDQTVVILGRDAWPLVPALRAAGIPCQYFLYSRLQVKDPSTEKQWLKEVPPGALVIDTGYAGSIPRDIERFDPSITWMLMAYNGSNYYQKRQLDCGNINHSELVRKVEKLPKLCGRCTGYNKNGNALTRQKNRDEDERNVGDTVKEICRFNEKLVSRLVKDDKLAKEYATFTGINPRERLGMRGPEREAHYKRVKELRKGAE